MSKKVAEVIVKTLQSAVMHGPAGDVFQMIGENI
jgi:hypothetical protein